VPGSLPPKIKYRVQVLPLPGCTVEIKVPEIFIFCASDKDAKRIATQYARHFQTKCSAYEDPNWSILPFTHLVNHPSIGFMWHRTFRNGIVLQLARFDKL
jgi:hypothetical protein